jgi:hypothetical protein
MFPCSYIFKSNAPQGLLHGVGGIGDAKLYALFQTIDVSLVAVDSRVHFEKGSILFDCHEDIKQGNQRQGLREQRASTRAFLGNG